MCKQTKMCVHVHSAARTHTHTHKHASAVGFIVTIGGSAKAGVSATMRRENTVNYSWRLQTIHQFTSCGGGRSGSLFQQHCFLTLYSLLPPPALIRRPVVIADVKPPAFARMLTSLRRGNEERLRGQHLLGKLRS